jgi:hypothetical protein
LDVGGSRGTYKSGLTVHVDGFILADSMDTNPVTLELYKRGNEAVEKFDYFICGVTGAAFSYQIQHYDPKVLRFDSHALEPLSLLLLGLSFFFGVNRLAASSLAANINHRMEDARDKAEQCARMLENPSVAREISGRSINVDEMKAMHLNFVVAWNNLQKPLDEVAARAKRYYRWRDRFLIAGFVAIFLAKVLQPYVTGVSPAIPATLTPIQQTAPPAIQGRMPPQAGTVK